MNLSIKEAEKESKEALDIIRLICKILYKANQINVLSCMKSIDAIRPWIEFICKVLQLDVPTDLSGYLEDYE